MNPQNFKNHLEAQNILYRNQPLPILHQNEPYVYLGIQLVPSLKWNIQTHTTTTKLIKQCKQLASCPVSMKQKINMADTVIRAGIAYSFYAVPYSMPAIKKLDRKLIALHKKICGRPNCTPNVTTQLPQDLFGMEAFSLKNAYLRCIEEQLRDALNDKGRIGKIYIGLTNYILRRHGGAFDIPRVKHTDCLRSPITRTFYLLKTGAGIHLNSELINFPLHATPLETAWMAEATLIPHLNQELSLKLLHKLLFNHITEISHLTLPDGIHLMNSNDFKYYYETPTKLINSALHIANYAFCDGHVRWHRPEQVDSILTAKPNTGERPTFIVNKPSGD